MKHILLTLAIVCTGLIGTAIYAHSISESPNQFREPLHLNLSEGK